MEKLGTAPKAWPGFSFFLGSGWPSISSISSLVETVIRFIHAEGEGVAILHHAITLTIQ